MKLVDDTYEYLEKINYTPPTALFKTLLYFYTTPNQLLTIKRFNKEAHYFA